VVRKSAPAQGVAMKKKLSKVCIVVPTYNEAKNIITLLDAVFSQNLCAELHVLVVDDSSPDGTARLVWEYAKKNKNVHLLLRKEKNGLGAAYIAGMQYALETLDPDAVCEMDADLSHDPAYLSSMLEELLAGADFVIGSRYVADGKIPDNWGIRRVMISKVANLLARLAVSDSSIRDCTGGYRMIRASALREVDFGSLNVKGYGFQILLLESIVRAGGVVREVPIAFVDRVEGESKIRTKDMSEFLKVIMRIFVSRKLQRAVGKAVIAAQEG